MSTGDGQPDRVDRRWYVEHSPAIWTGVVSGCLVLLLGWILDLQRVASAMFLVGCVLLVVIWIRWDRRPPGLTDRPRGTTVTLFASYLFMWGAGYFVGRAL